MEEYIIKELKSLNGHNVKIVTSHAWYGDQKILCKLKFINEDNRIGFQVKQRQICILKDKITMLYKKNNCYLIGNNLITIHIYIN